MEQKEMGKCKAHAVAIVTCTLAFASLSASVAAGGEQLVCIDARPDGELIKKRIVFEKNGVRSADMFPLLKSWNSATGIFDAVNNEQVISIKLSDWTALNVERVQFRPAAQTAMPTLISDTPVNTTVNPAEIVISDGLISLTSQGCAGTSPDQSKEKVFLGTITFGSNTWHVVGRYSTFGRPSWSAGPDRKPGP
jgi:hypothetical protein